MERTSFRFSVVTGVVFGAVLFGSDYLFISYGHPWLRTSIGIGVAPLAVMHIAGGFIGGVIFWLIQPLMAHGHAGRGLVGFLSCAPLGVAMALSFPASAMARTIIGLVMAALFGGGTFMIDRPNRAGG